MRVKPKNIPSNETEKNDQKNCKHVKSKLGTEKDFQNRKVLKRKIVTMLYGENGENWLSNDQLHELT